MSTYKFDDYEIFSTAKNTVKTIKDKIDSNKTSIVNCQNMLGDGSIFLGPAADSAKAGADTSVSKVDLNMNNFSSIYNYFDSTYTAYKSGDANAKKSILKSELQSDGTIKVSTEVLKNAIDDPSHYLNHLDDLKYGSFTREVIDVDGEKITCYVYRPDYGTDVTGLPVMMYMHGASMTGTGESIVTYGGLGEALNNKSITPSGIVVIPHVASGVQYESKAYRDKLNQIPTIIANKYGGDTNKLSVGGVSYGGLTAYNLVREHPGTYAAVVTACGAQEVDSSFKDVSVLNFVGESNDGNHTASSYVQRQSDAVNSVGGESKVIKINKQWAHTNVGTYAFQNVYMCDDNSNKEEYPTEWAFRHNLDKEAQAAEEEARAQYS